MSVSIKAKKQVEIGDILIGKSPAIVALKVLINKIAQSSASVMIFGPSGSGKEIIAQAIHSASKRADKTFVALNCGAIPRDLIESELFGHERGSFTGANARRTGRFEEAHGGTLFLDEIGDMPFGMQVKLLRILEDGIVTRVGGSGKTSVDVRVISATHQDIHTAISQNQFREDLYFRLGVVPIHVPPLSSRLEDIPLLVAHFQKKSGPVGNAKFDASAFARLAEHDWVGNVRELRNFVQRANVLFPGELIGASEIDQLLNLATHTPNSILTLRAAATKVVLEPCRTVTEVSPPAVNDAAPIPINLKNLLETMEQERIQMALDIADGVISEAARMLTLKRTTLIEKMRKYGVDRQC